MRVFIFGEAEKGKFCTPLRLANLIDLMDQFGNSTPDGTGIEYAIQTLHYQKEPIFFRVREEGFCKEDYLQGVKLLYNHGKMMKISAICMPGVGDREIVDAISPICLHLKTLLVLSEKDLYDYLTGSKY